MGPELVCSSQSLIGAILGLVMIASPTSAACCNDQTHSGPRISSADELVKRCTASTGLWAGAGKHAALR